MAVTPDPATYKFMACHPITRQFLGRLRFQSVSWTEAINGAATLTGTITVPRDSTQIRLLMTATEPDDVAIYVRNNLNKLVFGGIIYEQTWNPDNHTLTVSAIDFRSWLTADAFLGPKLDLTGDNTYSWTNKDQLQIARDIVGYATLGAGRPVINVGTETSGRLRQLNVKGLDFKYAGELIDTMSRRSDGFEWAIESYLSTTDGLPSLKLATYYPEKSTLLSSMFFRKAPQQGNLRNVRPITKDSSQRKNRIWTTGDSTRTTQEFAVDYDPAIDDGFTLLREKVTNYSTVTERTTLASHATAELDYRKQKNNTLTATTNLNDPSVNTYSVGDRARLIYEDDWYNIDLPAARIVQRTIKPYDNGGEVEVVFSLTDYELPEADE